MNYIYPLLYFVAIKIFIKWAMDDYRLQARGYRKTSALPHFWSSALWSFQISL